MVMGESLLSTLLRNAQPDQVVLSTLTDSYTLEQIHVAAQNLVAKIKESGTDILALYADNGPAWVIADLACQTTDTCLLPVPTFFTVEQTRVVLRHCQATFILVDNPASIAPALLNPVGEPDPAFGLQLFTADIDRTEKPLIPPGTGKITFTSGSSGDPKGVCLSNSQLLLQAKALGDEVALKAPRHLCLLPLSTLLENVAGVYAPLLADGEVIVPSMTDMGYEGSRMITPGKLLGTITRTAPETIILIPELLKLLVASARQGWPVPDSFRFIAVGGSKVGSALIEEAWSLGFPVYEGYGLSECASVVSLNTPRQRHDGSCGKPLPHLEVTERKGEIIVSGNPMLGYVNRPESWHQDSIRTGDLGSMDDEGFLHLSGRSKNILISSYGRNISPEWPESELLANPLLQNAVVFGDAMPYCVALLSPVKPGIEDTLIQQWIDNVNIRLPDYARIRKWHRLQTPLAMMSGMLTDNGRPRRAVIAMHFADVIDSLYASEQSAAMTEKNEEEICL